MKNILIFTVLFASALNLKASDFIACRDSKSVEYNAVFEFRDEKIVKFSTLELDFKTYIDVDDKDGILSFVFVSEYDTNFGYDVSLSHTNLQAVSLAAWTSGNDSDNYNGNVRDVKTECHLLKDKPQNSVFKIENYLKSIIVL